jgi:hypothetical protein
VGALRPLRSVCAGIVKAGCQAALVRKVGSTEDRVCYTRGLKQAPRSDNTGPDHLPTLCTRADFGGLFTGISTAPNAALPLGVFVIAAAFAYREPATQAVLPASILRTR